MQRSTFRLLAATAWRGLAAAVCLLGAACSSGGEAEGEASDGIAIPKECRGFAMEGIQYSPGGAALPNTCRDFDPTTNNPYAVRCVDVLPGYRTRYPGDEFCILPPPEDLGAQFGIHPQRADYWNQMWAGNFDGYADDLATAEFEVQPGVEIEQTYSTSLGNAEAQAWYRIESRMRIGSHHMATYKTSEAATQAWRAVDGETVPPGSDGGFFWNSQRSDTSRPVSTLAIPEDDEGLGSRVDANQGMLLDVHHYNTADVPILREAWINVWWVETLSRLVVDAPLVADVLVPPGQVTVLANEFAPATTTRVLSLFGHRHAWTRRINAWVDRADGTRLPVYDSFNWEEVPTFSYDSLSQNPVADVERESDGASSGLLVLEPGDTLRFSCHVDTTPAHAKELGLPVPSETLVFGNKAFDAEMCILYAQIVGGDEAP